MKVQERPKIIPFTVKIIATSMVMAMHSGPTLFGKKKISHIS